ncbi:MAG TPA: hypothetical protein VFQ93_01325 [Casimicrobiaceae bacterium]|nr:hypothetical protein [Casimicrobiaceae bacterium]
MRANDGPRDRKPECDLDVAFERTLRECCDHMLAVANRCPVRVVLDRHKNVAGAALGAYAQDRARRCMSGTVFEQVRDGVLDERRVDLHWRQFAFDVDDDPVCGEPCAQALEHNRDNRRHRGRTAFELNRAWFAPHDRERRPQIAWNRREEGAANAFGVDGGLGTCALGGLATRVLDEMRDEERHRDHDRERQDILHIVHRKAAARRNEYEVERQHRKQRRGNGRTAREAGRHNDDGKQVDHRDVDEVEARLHAESRERARENPDNRPCVTRPSSPWNHCDTLAGRP